jgi:predicted AlkP superfamily pyrophosphatase or phosphodiesterase
MTRIALLLTAVFGVAITAAQRPDAAQPPQEAQPRLVVLVAIDQLPTYLFDRYQDVFTGGFRRILDEGHYFTEGSHFHANTETAAGHAALSTGVLPNKNGIVANTWREPVGEDWTSVYAVFDSLSPITGIPSLPGRSPANMNHTGIADWMQAANPASKVVSLSRKDRSAITLAGKTSDAHVYWLLPSAGRWITSTYYREAYSRWFEGWHDNQLQEIFADSVWESSIPAGLESMSRGDTASYEGNGVDTYFPHRFVRGVENDTPEDYNAWISGTPAVDEATISLAEYSVRTLDLGQDDVPDFLGLALSQTDIIGHGYGPLSREQMDNLLRLDRHLGEFLDFLDEYVGEGQWVLGLSADHGVLTIPEALEEMGEFGKRTTGDEITELITAVQNASRGDAEGRARRVQEAAEGIDWIGKAYLSDQLMDGQPADSFEVLFHNAYVPGRATGFFGEMGVVLRSDPGVYATTGATGTSHGSTYRYDRHVPMLFMGPGVPVGSTADPVRTIDMAPTLAGLAGIPTPDDLDGRPLIR